MPKAAAETKYEDVTIDYFKGKGCVTPDNASPFKVGDFKGMTVDGATAQGVECDADKHQIKLLQGTFKELKDNTTVENGNCKDYTLAADNTEYSIKITWKGACMPKAAAGKNVLTTVDIKYFTEETCNTPAAGDAKDIHAKDAILKEATKDTKLDTKYIFECIEKDFTLTVKKEGDKKNLIDFPLVNGTCQKIEEKKYVKGTWTGACNAIYKNVKVEYFKEKGCVTKDKDDNESPITVADLKDLTVDAAKANGLECVDNDKKKYQIKLHQTILTKLKEDITVDNGICKDFKDKAGKDVSMKLSWEEACSAAKSGLSTGVIVAIVLACVALVGIIGGAFAYYKSS